MAINDHLVGEHNIWPVCEITDFDSIHETARNSEWPASTTVIWIMLIAQLAQVVLSIHISPSEIFR